MGSLIVAFIAAAVGIYLLLLLLFNSIWQPVLVMVAIPFGFVGVIFAFGLHQQALGFLAMLGIVGLTGIIVNDSLILVNLVNQMKSGQPDMPVKQRVVDATVSRLRPIVLTSITTVAGLLPMAYGLGGSDPFSAPNGTGHGLWHTVRHPDHAGVDTMPAGGYGRRQFPCSKTVVQKAVGSG